MSQENIEIAHRVLDAVAHRDLAALVEVSDGDVEWRSFFAVGEASGEYHGLDGLRTYVADVNEAWEALAPTIESALHIGPVVVAVGRIRYQGKGSGARGESAAGWLFKFREGKLVLFRAFRDPEESLEAVGL